MNVSLPPSLAATPNIPLREQTLEQLRAEHEYWDNKISNATSWGSAIAVANGFRTACESEIRRRETALANCQSGGRDGQ